MTMPHHDDLPPVKAEDLTLMGTRVLCCGAPMTYDHGDIAWINGPTGSRRTYHTTWTCPACEAVLCVSLCQP